MNAYPVFPHFRNDDMGFFPLVLIVTNISGLSQNALGSISSQFPLSTKSEQTLPKISHFAALPSFLTTASLHPPQHFLFTFCHLLLALLTEPTEPQRYLTAYPKM